MESALESFDFLNTSDFDDEDTGDDNSAVSRSVFFDMDAERIGYVHKCVNHSLIFQRRVSLYSDERRVILE